MHTRPAVRRRMACMHVRCMQMRGRYNIGIPVAPNYDRCRSRRKPGNDIIL